MGNCLDVEPPPPKPYNSAPHYHANGVKYRPKSTSMSHRSRASSSGSIANMPGTFSPYQPYTPYPAGPPQRPMVVMDPNTGQMYAYPPPIPMAPYPRHMYANGYYDQGYYEYDYEGIETERKSRKSRHSKRKENGDLDKNANRKSTVITTFPDPNDDVIIQGDHTMPSRITNSVTTVASDVHRISAGGDVTQHTSAVINTTDTTTTTTTTQHVNGELVQDGDQVDSEQVAVVRRSDSSAARASRGSTYITYIKDVPLPPPEVEEVQDTTYEQIESTTRETEGGVVEESSEFFVETSGPVEGVETLLVDQPISTEGFTLRERETTTTTTTTVSSNRNSAMTSRLYLLHGRAGRAECPVHDVVLTGASSDEDLIETMRSKLLGNGLTVFASMADAKRTEEELTEAGQAIVGAKILVVILSPSSVQSGQVRDEVSLAAVSNTVIFPLATATPLELLDRINMALKLQVASYKWTEVQNEDHPSDIVLDLFVNSLKEELEVINSNPDIIDEDFGEVSSRAERRHNLVRRRQLLRMLATSGTKTAAQFWNETYPDASEVEWSRFRRDFMQEFRGHLDSTLPKAGQLHVMDALRRELANEEGGMLQKAHFVVFCNDEGQDEDLWDKFLSFARENLAIRDIFDVESSVRLGAIENIGRFGSPAVMSALRDLLSDPDANIRAVAAVSLSRCIGPSDEVSFQLLMKTLDDNDRLVREAGCLAMGHLRATRAIPKLTDMWRNDVISHVREAASAALQEIGGDEAEEAMRVTRILTDEIRALT